MKNISTFSIVARDAASGDLGIAVQSKFLAVGNGVLWAKAGVGAVVTQALANMDFGELGLHILEKGYGAERTARALIQLDSNIEERQFGIVDAEGGSFSFTGKNCFHYAGGICGEDFAAQGNILVDEKTVEALARTWRTSEGSLAARLTAALDAAQNAGGDRRGRQSAALLVVRAKGGYGGYSDRYVDLRVDDDPDPIGRLRHLLDLHGLYFDRPCPKDVLPVDAPLAAEIQERLKKLGYYSGPLTQCYDELTKQAFYNFCGWENYEERLLKGDRIDRNVLQALRQKTSS